jgi:hypothetical protein
MKAAYSVLSLLAVTAFLAPATARAQTSAVDAGSFRLMVDGREVGSETFQIRQNGSGEDAVLIATGRTILDGRAGGREVESQLQVSGTGLRPAGYSITVDGADAQTIQGRVSGGRVSARIVSSSGENMREYLASQGAAVVDDAVAHQYYFVARLAGDGTTRIPMLIPQESRQVMAEVVRGAAESISVGGRSVQATRITVRPQGGQERIIWVDGQNRVLRLEIPGRNLVAERTELP